MNEVFALFMEKDGILDATPKDLNKKWVTCPFCLRGRVKPNIGEKCKICKAVVTSRLTS